jgi:2',3'-cyclic-nucleotide 2'-phosphodiesterase
MRLLFIGDVVGEPGRRAVKLILPRLVSGHSVEVVVANGENAAGGSGITPTIAEELFGYGIHAITCGDHLWDQKEVTQLLLKEKRFVRPGNYPDGVPGQGATILELPGLPPVGVMNLQGRTFMPPLENPFTLAKQMAKSLRVVTPIILLDMHAEATSEKIAMGRMLDGQVSAVVGTHTHVQTADEQIFPGGTAFLCDAGMTGPHDGCLGREVAPIIERFLQNTPQRFHVATERILLQGALIDIDAKTGKASAIRRVSEAI